MVKRMLHCLNKGIISCIKILVRQLSKWPHDLFLLLIVNNLQFMYFWSVSGRLRAVLLVKFFHLILSRPCPPVLCLTSMLYTVVMKNALFSTAVFGWWVLIQDSISCFRFVYSNVTVVKELLQRSATKGLSRLWDSKRQRQFLPCTIDCCETDESHAGNVPQRAFTCIFLTRSHLLTVTGWCCVPEIHLFVSYLLRTYTLITDSWLHA